MRKSRKQERAKERDSRRQDLRQRSREKLQKRRKQHRARRLDVLRQGAGVRIESETQEEPPERLKVVRRDTAARMENRDARRMGWKTQSRKTRYSGTEEPSPSPPLSIGFFGSALQSLDHSSRCIWSLLPQKVGISWALRFDVGRYYQKHEITLSTVSVQVAWWTVVLDYMYMYMYTVTD